MKVKYIYSACLEIDCDGFKILTDPWFTDGAYDGSWYQFPKVDPFDFISKPDLVYISHIHPDHYDATFLKALINKFGDIKILIPDLDPNYLIFKGKSDGLDLIPTRHFKNDKVELFIEENDTGSISDIDSALIVKEISTGNVLLNLNDCIYNQPHVDTLNEIIKSTGNKIDLLALGYTGAGPYPQTYISLEDEKELLISEGDKKKNGFFDRYKKYIETFNATYHLPFAGEYILGGKLSFLNDYRGVADAYEVKSIDDRAIVLLNGGEIDLVNNVVKKERLSVYSEQELKKRISDVKDCLLDYEKEIFLPIDKINFMRLLNAASMKAVKKSEVDEEYHLIFSILDNDDQVKLRFDINTQDGAVRPMPLDAEVEYLQFSEIKIDYRYLYGLLTTVYHWNNAEVGSQFFTKRYPLNNFKPKVQGFLNFLSIA